MAVQLKRQLYQGSRIGPYTGIFIHWKEALDQASLKWYLNVTTGGLERSDALLCLLSTLGDIKSELFDFVKFHWIPSVLKYTYLHFTPFDYFVIFVTAQLNKPYNYVFFR